VFEVGDEDRLPAVDVLLVFVVVELELVRVFEVEVDRAVLAVDLEGVLVLVAAGVAGGLEGAKGAVVELGQEGAGVVDASPSRPCRSPGASRSLMKVSVMAVTCRCRR
jgi:hypothetical protein